MRLHTQTERPFWPLAIGVFAALVVVNYFPIFLGRVPFPRDMVLQFSAWWGFHLGEPRQDYADIGDLVTSFYPFRSLISRAISESTLPLWNPYLLSGTPFLANSQSALFYPLNFFYFVLPLPVAWTVCIVLRMFLAAVFMALFARSMGASRAGAILAATIFASCGFMTMWQGQPMGDAAVWLPLICYAAHQLHIDPSKRSIAVAAFAFSMPVLAGHPETAAHVTLTGCALAFAFWMFRAQPGVRRFNMRFLFAFVFAGLLAIGLSSIQLVPTLEWLGEMERPLDITWPALNLDHALGLVSRDIVKSPNSAGIFMPEGAAYVGMFSFLLAVLAIFHSEKRHAIVLLLLTAFAAGGAYSIQPIHWMVSHTPILKALKNGRLILVESFGLAALAGLGLSALQQNDALLTRRRTLATIFLVMTLLFSFFLVYQLQQATTYKVAFLGRPSFSRFLLFVSFVPIVARLYFRLGARAFAAIMLAVAAFDLTTFGYGAIGSARPSTIYPRAAVFDFLSERVDLKNFRIAQVGSPYVPNANMMYGFPAADGYEIELFRSKLFSNRLADDRQDGMFFRAPEFFAVNDRRLDMMNVRYLVVANNEPEFRQFRERPDRFSILFNSGRVSVFENKSVLPRAFVVPRSGAEVVTDMKAQLARLTTASFNPEQTVFVGNAVQSVEGQSVSFSAQTRNHTEVVDTHINESTFRVDSSDGGVLVVSQSYYPGWKASVDGNATDVFPVDVALTGLSVPAGTHHVHLVYAPGSFRLGAALSLFSIAIVGALAVSVARSSGEQVR